MAWGLIEHNGSFTFTFTPRDWETI